VTDGRLLPFGLVLAALLVAGAAAAVLIDVRRGRRARAHAAPRGRRRAVGTLSEAAQQVPAQDLSTPQVWTPQVMAPDVPAPDLAAPDVTAPGSASPRPATGRHARPDADAAETWWVEPASPPLTWISQPTTAPAEFAERHLLVDRELSSVDLSFPFTASLADSLHDELFTHRAVRS
jgi:hypothetical protein